MDPRPGVTAWETMIRFQRLAMGAMDQNLQARTGHSLDEYDVLHQLSQREGPVRMGELAAALLVANSSCNRLVTKLVDEGLVHRRHGPEDRRQIQVALSPAGRRLHKRMAAVHTRDIERLMVAPLNQPMLEQLQNGLSRILAHADPDSDADSV